MALTRSGIPCEGITILFNAYDLWNYICRWKCTCKLKCISWLKNPQRRQMWDSDKTLYLLLQCLDWILCPRDKKGPPFHYLTWLLTCQTTLMHFVSACVCVCVCVWVYACVYRCINGHAVDGSGIWAKSGTLSPWLPCTDPQYSPCSNGLCMSLSLLPLFSNQVGETDRAEDDYKKNSATSSLWVCVYIQNLSHLHTIRFTSLTPRDFTALLQY